MKKFVMPFVAGVLVAAVAACGSTFDGTSQNRTHNGEIRKVIVQYEGKPLTCVQFDPGTNASSYACDFVKYHAENKNANP